MSPTSLPEAVSLVSGLVRKIKVSSRVEVVIAPPFVYTQAVGKKIVGRPISLGAQNVSHQPVGPFTGEVSVVQLKELGVSYVISGHSERRAMGETEEMIRQKVQLTLKHRLTPIVCVGERLRDENGQFFSLIEAQLRSLAEILSAPQIKKCIIAYEPIWAIGTGKTATPDDVKEMQLFIKSVLTKLYDRSVAQSVGLLYGGSVKADNVVDLHKKGDMNGFLVGGASLRVEEFANICASLDK